MSAPASFGQLDDALQALRDGSGSVRDVHAAWSLIEGSTTRGVVAAPAATAPPPPAAATPVMRVSASVGSALMKVPIERHATVAQLMAKVQGRCDSSVTIEGLADADGAALQAGDVCSDVIADGETVVCALDGGVDRSQSSTPSADGELDMPSLIHKMTQELSKAERKMRLQAEADETSKKQAEAQLQVFREVSKDPDAAVEVVLMSVRDLVKAEVVNIWFMEQMPGDKAKKLTLHQTVVAQPKLSVELEMLSGMRSIGRNAGRRTSMLTGIEEPKMLYDTELHISKGEFVVGIVAADEVSTKRDRAISIALEGATATLTSRTSTSTVSAEQVVAKWAADPSFEPAGPDVPEGFAVKNCMCVAIAKMSAFGQMVTEKTEEELKQLFKQFDDDGSGDLDREEISELAKSLGKKLTKRELDKAMQDMDEDDSGDVDFDEFATWWQQAFHEAKLGEVVAVLQVMNAEEAHQRALDLMLEFGDAIGHIVAEQAKNAEYAKAMSQDTSLAMYANKKQTQQIQKSKSQFSKNEEISPRRKQSVRQRRVSLDAFEISTLLDGLDLPNPELLEEWSFPCLDYTQEQLMGCVLTMFKQRGLLKLFKIPDETMMNFTNEVFQRYNEVPYHNFWHGFAVFQSSYWAITQSDELKALEPIDQFSLLVGSLCHDMDHKGSTNSFHIDGGDELAINYNDRSVLENMHAKECFTTARKEDCAIFASLSSGQYKRVRADIIHMILGTDMAEHGNKMGELKKKCEMGEKSGYAINWEDEDDREFWMSMILHGGDLGNPCYVWDQSFRWSRLCLTEFKAQTAREQAKVVAGELDATPFMGMWTPNVVEDLFTATSVPVLGKNQFGFAKFFVRAMHNDIAHFIPAWAELVENLDENCATWMSEGLELPAPVGAELTAMGYGKEDCALFKPPAES